ncbi:hypothetical protein [Nesterenkonia flava]|uniref:Uncharacterized protein n=1 Tax=Nesterenkonia flava TaxID=469799 RepID=A0ABU1FTQ1_9MICC|nr:hypothetical protein [Nesterenkonia flava]MDR5712045.1 hypothetical protein [Nesterenkonia flava]
MYTPESPYTGDPHEAGYAHLGFQRLTDLLEAHADFEESYNKLISRMADVNEVATVEFSSATRDAREELDRFIRQDVVPVCNEILDRLRRHQAKRREDMQRHPSSNAAEGGDHHE